jgi:uncharacterized protein (TIGR02265 family)
MALSSSEPIVSATTVEGLFVWALGSRITPKLEARLKEVGLDLTRSLHPAYPNDVWNRAVRCTMEELFPLTPFPQASYELGRMLMEGLPSTMIGKAGVQLLRILGPERTLVRMQRNHRATNNFTTAELTKVSPTHFRITSGILVEFHSYMADTRGVHYGPMNHGIYTGLLSILRVKRPRVTWREVDPAIYLTEYNLEWDPG